MSSSSQKSSLPNLEGPVEMTMDEYNDMVQQVAGLSDDEVKEEYLESCRYGEIDIIRILLRRIPSLVDHRHPMNGNSGLHMAAANGHVPVAKLLLECHHTFPTNESGNTPLHFAAVNAQVATVEFLTTQKFHDIDVLFQNSFGRSALTEGFSSQNEQVVKALLEHESATEEKLLQANGKSQSDHVHHFFDPQRPLKVRELAIANADNPFADTDRPDQDTTGLSIWSASLVLARWTRDLVWENMSVIELGAGCGVPGLAVAAAEKAPKIVYLTDLNPDTVSNMEHNIGLNGLKNSKAMCMDWSDTSSWPQEKLDVVIGSDLVYQESLVPLLQKVVLGLLKPGGSFYYVAPESGRAGLDTFIEEMSHTFPEWSKTPAPPEYTANPLTNQDDEECFMHFNELSTLKYFLYEFKNNSGS
eukprot:Nitzschia sp. Nitz4//scaffold4_size323378//141485//142729//NITZ4_000657-RA/size323378-processed-gene-0.282-mRNA-1//1//CDS//3329553390//1471//frame0